MIKRFKGGLGGIQHVLRGFYYNLVYILWYRKKKYFQVGDLVEDIFEHTGKVWSIYKKEGTNIPVACSIRWENGHYSMYVSWIADKGDKYNPVLRKKKK